MAEIRSFTGFLTSDLVGTENVAANQTFDPGATAQLLVVFQDDDPIASGDPSGEQSSDPEGNQIAFLQDSSGTVLVDGSEFYLEMSFTFTVAGQTFTGYQFEIEGTGQDFVILPPDVPAGTATVNSIDFTPTPDEAYYWQLASGNETVDASTFSNLDQSNADLLIGGDGSDNLSAGGSDDIVYGNAGDDTLNADDGDDYVVGGQGDDVILGGSGNDTIESDGADDAQATRLSFNWSLLADPSGDGSAIDAGDDLSAGVVQDTGGIEVAVAYTDLGPGSGLVYQNAQQYTSGINSGAETVVATSAGRLTGDTAAAPGNTSAVEFTFSSTNAAFSDEVSNVSFRLNDLDDGGWRDTTTIEAFDADGNSVPVTLTSTTQMTETDTNATVGTDTVTVVQNAGGAGSQDANASLQIDVLGPVERIVINYGNAETGGQLMDITDIFFDASPTANGNDSVEGGDGDDFIVTSDGDDTVYGDNAGGSGGNGQALNYEWYELDGTSPSTLADAGFDASGNNSATPDATGTSNVIDVQGVDTTHGGDNDTYAVKYTTTLTVTTAGTYDFSTSSDDGSKLFVDGVEIVDNDGLHGLVTANGSTTLTPGEHLVEIIYFESGGGDSMSATISGPDTGGTPISFETAAIAAASSATGSGNDTIDLGAGDDLALGGSGADSIIGDVGEDTICGDDGDDTLQGGADADTLDGGAGADVLTAGTGADLIQGGSGADTIDAGIGDDTINGDGSFKDPSGFASSAPGAANNITFVNNADGPIETWLINTDGSLTQVNTLQPGDTAVESSFEGQNYVFRAPDGTNLEYIENGQGQTWPYANESMADSIVAGDGDDVVDGLYGDDTIAGGAGNDTLIGSYGADLLDGGDGQDRITLTSDDTATGGADADVFVVADEDNSASTITDFDASTGVTDGDPLDQTDNDFVDLSGYFSGLSELRNANIAGPGADVVLDLGDGQTLTMTGVTDVFDLNQENVNVICFARGTLIRTPNGDVPVEDLVVGDLVTTLDDGPQKLRWVGSRYLSADELRANPKIRPINIAKGTLGNTRDLMVSPQHRMLLTGWRAEMLFGQEEVLASAKSLINDEHIYQVDVDGVEFFHLLFDAHEIVFAEGALAESLLPGAQAMASLTMDARLELETVFPQIFESGSDWIPARRILAKSEAKAMSFETP